MNQEHSIILKGITWNHSRGIVPLQAASQRFHELHPNIEIQWEKRSLQEFADYPIEKLTQFYDLLIIDHPWTGTAAALECVLPLNEYLPVDFLKNLSDNSVGQSHQSYNYNNKQWALAIDGASPVASYRPDLFEKFDEKIPETWTELLILAQKGKVAVPAIPIDLLMNFYTFCIACGNEPFKNNTAVIDAETGSNALKTMKQLYALVATSMFNNNPIDVANLMVTTDDYWYCPFAYCYSNYSRKGYGNNILQYGNTVTINGQELLTTLGGTGISVSRYCQNKETALDFLQMLCSPKWLAGEYILTGGQPGYTFGWEDGLNNLLTNNFFKESLPVIERSFVRPRYHGYLYFQDLAGEPIQQYLMGKIGDEGMVLQKMNEIYTISLQQKVST